MLHLSHFTKKYNKNIPLRKSEPAQEHEGPQVTNLFKLIDNTVIDVCVCVCAGWRCVTAETA